MLSQFNDSYIRTPYTSNYIKLIFFVFLHTVVIGWHEHYLKNRQFQTKKEEKLLFFLFFSNLKSLRKCK
jgi:hypothetical protein